MSESRQAQFARMQAAYGPALGRVVRSYARPGADQEDLAQDVALALWRALPSFRGECPERAFVLRVAHNRGLNHLWRKKPADSLEDEARELVDPAPPLEVTVADKQDHERLFSAIRQLPLSLRQVLTLALEELPHAEIAEALGISTGAVDVRLSRARAALRKLLNEEGAMKEAGHG